ncbi:MAG: hypothetical protein JNL35_06240 [Sphingopyxis sp.]|nr:hypothetical protein [Sphingopyxis sp.]
MIIKGQNLFVARLRHRNGEDIGQKYPPGTVVLFPRAFSSEIEAISMSLRDLIDFVHGCVGEPWNILICLRLASQP